jgi:uncharacterized membrane protein YhaH (DUF805 family)
MDIKEYCSPSGRIGRKVFWLHYTLPLLIIVWTACILDIMVFGANGLLIFLGYAIAMWPSLVSIIKRWHDRDRSGWFSLIWMIPIVGLWALVECGFLKGTSGANRFGPDPLKESDIEPTPAK